MQTVDIIIPVMNEARNVRALCKRIHAALTEAGWNYRAIFIVDHSTDNTFEVLEKLSSQYPLVVKYKQGKPGKAYSVLEGVQLATSEYVVMIDGDLQYPPEAIPKMLEMAPSYGVVIAERKKREGHFIRHLISLCGAYIVGKLLLHLLYDVQSGLKVFRRDIVSHIDTRLVYAWSLDIPLLHTARELGYEIGTTPITFVHRVGGSSKVRFISTTAQILFSAFKTRFAGRKVYVLDGANEDSMVGASIAYRRKRFVTHSTLSHEHSAIRTFTWQQVLFVFVLFLLIAYGFFISPLRTAIGIVGTLTVVYCIDVLFNFFLVMRSLRTKVEVLSSTADLEQFSDADLPVYSVLCPLYKEAAVLPQFIDAMQKLVWPKDKLEVLLLLEEDDTETIAAAKEMGLPDYIRIVVVPHSFPKTKPKACNYGLSVVTGEYVVIYDAEDKPEPMQLKKAYLTFSKFPQKGGICLQAKLGYYNSNQNILTRLFSAEYALWFDLVLPGLQSIGAIIPLGGTSNHFYRGDLESLRGWDPFNVTEDCDLGTRLFLAGLRTAIIDSITYEEANSHLGNWIRQRSRWIKGYMQTYLVHTRRPIRFAATHGWHTLIFHLVVGGKIAFMFINPFLWIATIAYFSLYSLVGPVIEAFYPPVIFYMGAFSLVFGNFLFLYYYLIGCAKREHWDLMKYVYLIPFYWLCISVAALRALFQLIFHPHFWEKTHHGLHLNAALAPVRSAIWGGGVLVVALGLGNVFQFLYNAYLGRVLSLEEFGLVSLLGSFTLIASIIFNGLATTVSHRAAQIFGRRTGMPKMQWLKMAQFSLLPASVIASIVWISSAPLFQHLFHETSTLPWMLIAPIWIIGTATAVTHGLLSGTMRFGAVAGMTILESGMKFVLAVVLVTLGFSGFVYGAIPAALAISLVFGLVAVFFSSPKARIVNQLPPAGISRRFLSTALLGQIATVAILTLDIMLAKYYLSPEEAGQYALLSLAGKMVFFLGNLCGQFITPLISEKEGSGKNSDALWLKLFAAGAGVLALGVVAFGLLGNITIPLLLGSRAQAIVPFLPVYTLAMAFFGVTTLLATYHQARKHYSFSFLVFLLLLTPLVGILLFHDSIGTIAMVMLVAAGSNLAISFLFHTILANQEDKNSSNTSTKGKKRILILNWRDTKHAWAGGAEAYLHEIAKRWVAMGHDVTLFCGNDGRGLRREDVDGVHIIRRGGFYFVYIWAFFYYQRYFQDAFDVIVDSANGIPFFTPLYVKQPTKLLIYHVHQEVFRKSLRPPFSWIALFMESKIMPMVYRNTEVITISPTSKADIIAERLTSKEPAIVYSGVDGNQYILGKKSKDPLILCLGRLKEYKSVPVFIYAASKVLKKIPAAKFVIAGDGEEKQALVALVKKLGLEQSITFTGSVTEKEKIRLYQRAWVFVNPSLMEGWGMTTIEANACGTPVVASDVGGLRDSVKNFHNGLLVPYGDVDGFANAIIELMTNEKKREEMSSESVVWARQFDWNVSAEQFLQLLA